MKKVEFYPSSISQPNKNKSSGLSKYCFYEIRRNGKKYTVNCRDQKDPKYHHQWKNVTNLKTGKTAQCGFASKYHCNHKKYYDIKGYRNTCPIAGVTGTYTQPATLRLKFGIKSKLKSTVKVSKVVVSLQHRCVGVDVSNSKTTVEWGPNFYGFNHYPNRKALKLKFVNKEGKALSKTITQGNNKKDFANPPLSTKYNTINATFTDVTYNDLLNGYLDVIYGNNLSTNPGNIYIRKLKIKVYYEDATSYIEGTTVKNTGLTTTDNTSPCLTTMKYNIEVGYKEGKTKMSPSKAPKVLQDSITIVDAPNEFPKQPVKPNSLKKNATSAQKTAYNKKLTQYNKDKKAYDTEIKKWVSFTKQNDKKTVVVSIKDLSGIPGEKSITFGLSGTKKQVKFVYNVDKVKEPTISVVNKYEHNTAPNTCAITAKNGCASSIKVYLDSKDNLIKEFTNLDNSRLQNIIPEEDCIDLYNKISRQSCGFHSLFVQINNNQEMIEKTIEIIPVKHSFEISINGKQYSNKYEATQNKSENEEVTIKYLTKKTFVTPPVFKIYNPTYTTSENKVGEQTWNISQGNTFTTDLGLFRSGKYTIEITEQGNTVCKKQKNYINIRINPEHKQYFDELFVKFGYGTAVTYDYLVAWEGDSIQEPIDITKIQLYNSVDKIKFCSQKNVTAQIGQTGIIPLTITNNAFEDVQNLYIELNVLKDDGYGFNVTTDEWVEEDGLFKNFKENFEQYNAELNNFVEVINLSKDDDLVDEENVYLKIKFLKRNQSMKLSIPFLSRIEKNIKLQLLLFDNVSPIYPITCTGTTFEEINIKVNDAILIDLNIFGNFDIFSDSLEIGPNGCPEECFTTGPITYFAKNIDTSNLTTNPKLIIKNDPRLEPIQFIYGNTTYNIGQKQDILKYNINNNDTKKINSINKKVHCEYTFPNHDTVKIDTYSDEEGKAKFFIKIPKTLGNEYKLQDILQIANFNISEDTNYAGCILTNGICTTTDTVKRAESGTYLLEPINDYINYKPGNIIPITLKCFVEAKYISNELVFTAPIKKANASSSIQIIYKVCHLDKNYGIIETTFNTPEDNNNIMPTTISKKIYFGVPTDTEITTNLSHRIVEKTHMNRLQIGVRNKRPNKNVKIKITELPALALYELMYYDIDDGYIEENSGIIYWCIDYLEENTQLLGNFDFKAKEVGLSQINVSIEDFLTNKQVTFGKDSYKCNCRK